MNSIVTSTAASTVLLDKPTSMLLTEFGAGKSSPGSGSAAALMGLLACKLLITVSLKTLEKQDRAKYHTTFKYMIEHITNVIEPKLKDLFERDAQEFEEVVRLRIERDNATDSATKSALSRQANDLLEVATNNSFEIVEQCFKLADHGITAFENGWQAVRGDSGAAISAAIAGVTSGVLIASLNLKALKERKFAVEKINRCDEIYKELTQKQERAFKCVTSLNREALDAMSAAQPDLLSN